MTGATTIERRPIDAALVCSDAQQRLWFLEQLEPGSAVHNLAFAIRLTGTVDVGLLGQALGQIAERHEACRTVFPTVDGRPVPSLLPATAHHLAVDDLELRGAVSQLGPQTRALAHAPFDIAREPLVRVKLWRLGDREHAMAVVAHHLVSDGWSMGVFLFELFTLYAALRDGRSARLPALPIQYGDYAHWQQRRGKPALTAQRAYWRTQLGGELPVLDLPTDRVRPLVESTRGDVQQVAIPRPLVDQLRARATETGTTLFMALVAGYAALLHRYSGDTDLLIGTPVANRSAPELEGLIGVFINTVVLRLDLTGEPSLGELVQRVRDVATGAFAHQDLPFEQLVGELRPNREFGHAPLFQTMFVLRNSPIPAVPIPGVTTRRYPIDSGASRFDLSLIVETEGDELFAWFEYKTDLFSPETMAQLARDYPRLLEVLVADPAQQVRDVALVPPEDLRQLAAWGTGPALAIPAVMVPAQIAGHAVTHRDAVAVVCGGESLTYGGLVSAARALAAELRAAGVGRGTAVPILIDRSVQTVVAIVGVLAAGGGYVPLDPASPANRIAAVLRELAAPVIVVPGDIAPPADAPRVLRPIVAADPGAGEPLPAPQPDDLAYVIYTSGSTGVPKGVAVTHRNLAASNAARSGYYGAGIRPRFLVLSSFAFDSSIAGLFWTLTQGGTVILPTESAHLDVPQLAALVHRHGATHVLTLPSVYALLVDQPHALGSLTCAIVAGEACPAELIHRHHAQLRGVPLFNEYGPTEATVWATVHELGPDDGGGRVPIGRPIAGARLYVLDAQLQPVPIGVIGELWIGGPGVARGYVERGDLAGGDPVGRTAFHSDPWAGPGARMYGTGDRVRFRRDGVLEFWGRRDHQVKIRGHRVELEDIEAALCSHPAVSDAAVAVHGASPSQVLAAHVVTDAAEPAELRAWLVGRVPSYMVPSLFAIVPALPRTSTGKLDRGALRPPAIAPAAVGHVAPSTALQRTVIEIWRQALGVERVGIDDNFFELGGQSFLVMQVHAELSKALARELPVVALFQHPTVRTLTSYLGDAATAEPAPEAVDRRAARQRLLHRGGRVRIQDGD
ncbi:MAG TPA: amino acid adenylation domain-containing protein [Kofleriaceae bacterium]|nr:amino acid adenylation domain-containing protein [Kofleriaceae bacterium]